MNKLKRAAAAVVQWPLNFAGMVIWFYIRGRVLEAENRYMDSAFEYLNNNDPWFVHMEFKHQWAAAKKLARAKAKVTDFYELTWRDFIPFRKGNRI